MKIRLYVTLLMVSAVAFAQTSMIGTPELSNEAVESDTGLKQQEMEDMNQENMQEIEGVENQDSPIDMSTVLETTPSF